MSFFKIYEYYKKNYGGNKDVVELCESYDFFTGKKIVVFISVDDGKVYHMDYKKFHGKVNSKNGFSGPMFFNRVGIKK